MTGSRGEEWDDRRLDAAFQGRFDRPAPLYLRERIVQDVATSRAAPPLLRTFRVAARTAITAIAIFVAVLATMSINGIGPTLSPRASSSASSTRFPTTPPLIGTVGAPFPSSIRPSGSDATYAVLSVPDAMAIRDRGVDSREIAVAGWYVPPPPIACLSLGADALWGCPNAYTWLLGSPDLRIQAPLGPPNGPAIQPVTKWVPASTARLPIPVVFVGHFDDARAASCPAAERRQCQDRFVVDTVGWDLVASLADFPVEIDGLPVISVSGAILDRETDLSGELAIAGWFQASPRLFCPFVAQVAVPFMEGGCEIRGTWLMETPESIMKVTSIGVSGGPPAGPAINPVFPTVAPPADRPQPIQGGSIPTKVIMIGHFNDRRASLCSREAPQVCLGRFVVDAVPWVEGAERVLPERTDAREQATPAPFDPVTRIREAAGNLGAVLNVAAVSGAELIRIEPEFDLVALHESIRGSFWIVTGAIYGPAIPMAGTFVVDEQGAVFLPFGTHFELIGFPGPSPGQT
jgi:hypothetical protein